MCANGANTVYDVNVKELSYTHNKFIVKKRHVKQYSIFSPEAFMIVIVPTSNEIESLHCYSFAIFFLFNRNHDTIYCLIPSSIQAMFLFYAEIQANCY